MATPDEEFELQCKLKEHYMQECLKANQEIERLKELLKYEIQCNTIDRMEYEGYRTVLESKQEIEKSWQQFKQANNL